MFCQLLCQLLLRDDARWRLQRAPVTVCWQHHLVTQMYIHGQPPPPDSTILSQYWHPQACSTLTHMPSSLVAHAAHLPDAACSTGQDSTQCQLEVPLGAARTRDQQPGAAACTGAARHAALAAAAWLRLVPPPASEAGMTRAVSSSFCWAVQQVD